VTWVLIAGAGSGVSVNGLPSATGLRIVSDRDENPYLGRKQPLFLDRKPRSSRGVFRFRSNLVFALVASRKIEKGSMAVRCPSCGVWASPD